MMYNTSGRFLWFPEPSLVDTGLRFLNVIGRHTLDAICIANIINIYIHEKSYSIRSVTTNIVILQFYAEQQPILNINSQFFVLRQWPFAAIVPIEKQPDDLSIDKSKGNLPCTRCLLRNKNRPIPMLVPTSDRRPPHYRSSQEYVVSVVYWHPLFWKL